MTEIKRLEREIAEKTAKLNQLKHAEKLEAEGAILPAEAFTPMEKIEKFDKLHAHVMDIIERIREQGFMDEDEEHYLYEHAMVFVASDPTKFWKYFNRLLER